MNENSIIEQYVALQKRLMRSNRILGLVIFCGSLGLLVLAPFASYEIQDVKCYQKDENVVIITQFDTVVGKQGYKFGRDSLRRMEGKIERLESIIGCDELEDAYKSEIDTLTKQLTDCQEQLAEAEQPSNDCGAYKAEIVRLERTIRDLKKLLEESSSSDDCSSLKAENAKLLKEIRGLNAQVAKLEKALANCGKDDSNSIPGGGDLNRMQLRLNKYVALYESCEDKVEALTAENNKLTRELKACKTNKSKTGITLVDGYLEPKQFIAIDGHRITLTSSNSTRSIFVSGNENKTISNTESFRFPSTTQKYVFQITTFREAGIYYRILVPVE